MKKLLAKIIGATTALAMAIGVGVGITNSKQARELDAAYSGSSPWAYTFATADVTTDAQPNKTLNNVSWSISSAVYKGWDATKGIQIGSGSNPQTEDWTMTAAISQFGTNIGITSISVGISTASKGGIAWSLTAGGSSGTNSTGSSDSAITSVTTKTATYTTPVVSGNVVIALNSNSKSKAIYIHDISIGFTNVGGGDPNPTTYSVTYYDTGCTSGTVPTDANTYESGDHVTVAGNTGNLVKTGYTWSGWSINSNGSGTAYGPTYTTTYEVATSNVNFYPIWVKDTVPLPASGTITIDPTILGDYGTDVAYTVEEDSTPDSAFGFSCTDVTKGTGDNTGKLQFKKQSGTLYSTTPLSYIRSVTIGGVNTSDATVTYGTTANSGCTNSSAGLRSTYFKIVNSNTNYARYWTITITYDIVDPQILTGLEIASGLGSVQKSYDAGDSFNPTGLVIQAEWNDVLDTEHNVIDDVTWSPNPLTPETTQVTGTYTHSTGSETVTVTGLTVTAPDFTLDGNDNAPDGLGTDTSITTTGHSQIDGTGVEYGYYAFAINVYNNERSLEFNRAVENAYIGNNDSYEYFIRKITVTLKNGNNFSKLRMYKGDSAIPGTTIVSPNGLDGANIRSYSFGDDSEYFALKQTTTGTWVAITKIDVFLGSHIPVVDEVCAEIKSGTYYAGTTLSASNFDVLVTWTGGKADTAPTEGFTWTVNGVANGTLAVGDNSVVLTYEGVDSDPFNVVGAPASAQDVIENTLTTQSSLSYHYSKNANTVTDSLDRDFTELTGTGYQDWSGKTAASNAVYAGKSYATNNDAIQIRTTGSDCGIVTTTSGGKAKTITVVWNSESTDGKTIDVYGKNTSYSSAADLFSAGTQGTSLGSIVSGTSTSLTISGDYEYIGIRSNNGAVYLDSVDIVWATGYSYDYSNAAIRFGGFINQDLWDELDTNEHNIEGYGVLLTTDGIVGENDDIADAYSLADGTTIIDYYSGDITPTPKSVPSEATTAQKTAHGVNVEDHYYIWNVYFDIDEADFDTTYVAGAYIKLKNGTVVFMKKASFSVYSLAADYIANRGYNGSTAGGSLGDLASHA